jgi:hypothetical protein
VFVSHGLSDVLLVVYWNHHFEETHATPQNGVTLLWHSLWHSQQTSHTHLPMLAASEWLSRLRVTKKLKWSRCKRGWA